jgi:lactoylglutathione lyase
VKLGYTIVHVADVNATLAFYELAFGFERGFVHESGDYAELRTGETTLAFASIALGQSHFADPIEPVSLSRPAVGIELAFVSDDVAAAFDRACAAGAQALAPPEAKPWGQTVAYVRSLEGTLIELCSPIVGSVA